MSIVSSAKSDHYVVPPEAVRHYRTRGHVTLYDVMQLAELQEIKDRVDGMLAGRYAFEPAAFIVGAASKRSADDPGRATYQVMATRFPIEDEVLARYGEHPRLKNIAALLMGTEEAGIFQQQALVKPPGEENPTPWHQDDFYFRTDFPAVTAWIPLEPVTRENGTLRLVPGSHLQPVAQHTRAGGISDFHEAQIDIEPEATYAVVAPLGSVSFHDKRTLHGSLPNRSAVRRIAIAQHYSGGDVATLRRRWNDVKARER